MVHKCGIPVCNANQVINQIVSIEQVSFVLKVLVTAHKPSVGYYVCEYFTD